jgi:hypothetical protein
LDINAISEALFPPDDLEWSHIQGITLHNLWRETGGGISNNGDFGHDTPHSNKIYKPAGSSTI